MTTKNVNLILPGLFGAFQESELCDVPQSALLQMLIGKANHITSMDFSALITPDQYLEGFALAFYESDNTNPAIVTVYAEPLNLEIKSDHITAYPVTFMSDEADKVINIVEQFNKYFDIDGLKLCYQTNGRLICTSSLHKFPLVKPVYSIIDRDIKHFMPSGPDAKVWLRLFNEVQMFFHEYIPADERIFKAGLLNGLWFWGGASGNEISDKKIEGAIIGESDWLKGYCSHHSVSHCEIKDIAASNEVNFSVLDERLLSSSSYGDFELWSKQINTIDNEIVQPLVDLLKANKINAINIIESDKSIYQYKKNHSLRFFRRPKTLTELCIK